MSASGGARGLFLPMVLVLVGSACGGSSGAGEKRGLLLLSRLSVSVVSGGSDRTEVMSPEGGTASGTFSARSSDEAVATATVTGSSIEITGVGVGSCLVEIASADGLARALPVQVYDPRAMDTGELLISFTTRFQEVYHPLPSSFGVLWGEIPEASAWRPIPPDGFYGLGSLVLPEPYFDPNGVRTAMVVRGKTESAVAATTQYQLVSSVRGIDWTEHGVFWRPVCPAGYEALGMVMTTEMANSAAPVPPAYPTACVREDLGVEGSMEVATIRNTVTRSGSLSYSVWRIDRPVADSESGAYLAAATHAYTEALTAPGFEPVNNVLEVDLQLLGEAPAQVVLPRLTGYDEPQEQTAPLFTRAILVPCITVKDPFHDAAWQVANSPFYRLERQVVWMPIDHYYNATSVLQPNTTEFTAGITTAETTRISEKTNISVSAEVGIELKDIFSAKVTTTISREMGYETESSVSELRSRTDTLAWNAPPFKAVALWQKYSRFVLYRHNGAALEPVDSWTVGIDSFYIDEYPDD